MAVQQPRSRVRSIEVVMGANTLPPYIYPLTQLQQPDLFRVPLFERSHVTNETVYDGAKWTLHRMLAQSEPGVWLFHSAGCVMGHLALAALAQQGRSDLVRAAIYMCPANIGPGTERLFTNPFFDLHAVSKLFRYATDCAADPRVVQFPAASERMRAEYAAADKKVPEFSFAGESVGLIVSALDGSASASTSFPPEKIVVVASTDDVVTTPAMIRETITNIGVSTEQVLWSADRYGHHIPFFDLDMEVLQAALTCFGLCLPQPLQHA